MAIVISKSAEETFLLGQRWGEQAPAGWLLGLSGELGAGKTQLVKGLAAGLGASARVHSPTFALAHEYPGGRLPLFHLDLFRLENVEQIQQAGLLQFFSDRCGVTVVEWIEHWQKEPAALRRELEALDKPGRWARLREISAAEREIQYEDFGARVF